MFKFNEKMAKAATILQVFANFHITIEKNSRREN